MNGTRLAFFARSNPRQEGRIIQNFKLDDKRRFPRVRITASAIVTSTPENRLTPGKQQEIATVENLSAGGALLLAVAPMEVGERIKVILVIGDSQPIKTFARVTRCWSIEDRWQIAIRFNHKNTATEDQIQEQVLQELERIRSNPAILVLCRTKERFRHFESSYLSMGRRVFFSEDPQDALWLLQDPGTHIDTVFVELSLVNELVHSTLAFLEREYPEIRRILVLENGTDITGTEFRAHALVQEPLDHGFLGNLLGLRSGRFQNELLIERILKDIHPA